MPLPTATPPLPTPQLLPSAFSLLFMGESRGATLIVAYQALASKLTRQGEDSLCLFPLFTV